MRLELESETIAHVATMGEETDGDLEQMVDAATLLKGGIAAAQKGDRETARDLLTHAAKADPSSADAWMWLASISEYPEELLAFLSRVLDIHPENQRAVEWHAATCSLLAKTFVQRGIAAHNEGDSDLARSCFDEAIDHDGRCAPAWFWKASVVTSDEEKIGCLEQALALDPDHDDAQQALDLLKPPTPAATLEEAKWAAVAGKRKKALEMLDEVLGNGHGTAEGWVLRSHLSINLNDKLESLEKALEIDPEDPYARASYDFLAATVRGAQPVDDAPAKCVAAEPVEEQSVNHTPAEYEAAGPADSSSAALPAWEPTPEDRSIEEIFGSPVENVGPDSMTADSVDLSQIPKPTDELFVADKPVADEPMLVEIFADEPEDEHEVIEATEFVAEPDDDQKEVETAACAFCAAQVDPQAFECSSCRAILTLSDIESLLANQNGDRDAIQPAVTQMEAEWNFREFGVEELVVLGIGYFNLRSFEKGFKYLQEALSLDPNNVILAGQVNALAIRLDEIRRQDEIDEAKPRGKSILVVDDSPTVRKLISAKLEKSGHNVTCASDGVEGLEKLESGLPDLVLLDIAMPRLDGYEVCKQIRTKPGAADLPVVMISGKDGFFDKVRGKMAGCTGYVTKPFGPETLMKALETYLLPENGHAE